ncbi:DUF506 domain-containing protein [Cephalotus follicularis]|uniref:DUF506 domain-containing protein n=1 Tax=Cephalotus follicularis TaxID=3775 RepID=A0A1Q3BBB3_CEPFO|nr:DUF506 domain-containing protein [Cephalotus follicularis]
MAKIPVKFKRVAAAFNEASRVRLCESSGSEYSPDTDHDLSDLVNSFIERDYGVHVNEEESVHKEIGSNEEELERYWSDYERKKTLEGLLLCNDDDHVKRKIRDEVEVACGIIGDRSSLGFKRRLMTRLRERDFDAGLCKSQWEKFGRHPPGTYEYIDVNFEGNRYIVEVFVAGEFEIARPTNRYTSLLDLCPQVLVARPEELKQLVMLMCAALRESMKSVDLHMPPWRRNGYMQAKWFGPYKRTTNEISTNKSLEPEEVAAAAKRSIGFKALPVKSYRCGENFARKVGLKVGHLTAAFNGIDIGMEF